MRACRLILVLLPTALAASPLPGQARPHDTLGEYIARARQAASTLPGDRQSKLLALLGRSCLRHVRREADDCLAQAARAAARLEPGQASDRLHLLAEAYAEAGQADRALQTAAAIDSFSRRSRALAAVAVAQAKIMDLQAAERSFDQAKRAAGADDEPPDRVESLLAVARAQGSLGRRADAAATVKLAFQEALGVEDDQRRVALLEAVALAWARADQLDQARSAARWMGIPYGQRPEDVRSVLPRFHLARLLPQFALFQFHDGQAEQASETLRRAEEAAVGITYDDDQAGLNRCELLCRLAAASVEIGEGEFALQVLGQARDLASGVRLAWHRRQVARLLARAGDDKAAHAVADDIAGAAFARDRDARREQALAYSDLADEQFRAGRPQPALRSVELARAAARACPESTTCDCLAHLAFVLLDAGRTQEARATLDQAAQHLQAMASKSREHLAMRIAEGLARCDDLPAARKLLEQHVDAQRSYEARAALWPVQIEKVKSLAQRAQAESARRAADEIVRDGADPLMLASALLEAGSLDLATHYFGRAQDAKPAAPDARLQPPPGDKPVGFAPGREKETGADSRPAVADRLAGPVPGDPAAAELVRKIAASLSSAGRHDDLAAFARGLGRDELRAWLYLGAVEGHHDKP